MQTTTTTTTTTTEAATNNKRGNGSGSNQSKQNGNHGNNNHGNHNNDGNHNHGNNNDDDGNVESATASPTKSPSSPSPTKIKDPSEIFNELPEEEKEYIEHIEKMTEEEEAAKIGLGFFVLTFSLMICTAQQMGENPDGVFANVCRLAITVTGCFVKIILFPFKKLFGFNTNGYAHHLVTTQEFRDPYSRSNLL